MNHTNKKKDLREEIVEALEDKDEEEMSEADVLNEIEDRVRKGKKTTQFERDLLVESYNAYAYEK